jgi:hypothetical protein
MERSDSPVISVNASESDTHCATRICIGATGALSAIWATYAGRQAMRVLTPALLLMIGGTHAKRTGWLIGVKWTKRASES